MHHGAFFAQAKAGSHSQHDADRLDEQRPLAQEAPDDETTQNGFDLVRQKQVNGFLSSVSPELVITHVFTT